VQKYSNEMIAQANAMEAQGISTRRTTERLRRLFPGEDIPAQTSVSAWRRTLLGSAQEELEENEVRIALRCDELVEQKLDWSEKHMAKARLAELIMGAGVYRDKPMKRAALNTPNIQAQNITINFISQKKPEIIEGEVVE